MLPALAAALTLMAASDVQGVAGTAPPTTAAVAQAQTDRDKVVCRNQPVTGSRFTKRVCMTKGQWDEWAKQSQDSINQITQHSTIGMPTGGGFSGH